jgi:hypothetical protein
VRWMYHNRMPEAVCANLDLVSFGAIFLHLIDNSHTITEEDCNLMITELTSGYQEFFPASSTALLWLLQKRGLASLRNHANWNGLSPHMMLTALPPPAVICLPALQRSLPAIPRVVKCAAFEGLPLRLNDQHLSHMYGQEDPTAWARDVNVWTQPQDDDDDEGSRAFCFLPLATYLPSLGYNEDGEPKNKDVTVVYELLRSALERQLLCARDDAAQAILTAEKDDFHQQNDDLREVADQGDAEAQKELERREERGRSAYDMHYSFSVWWREAREMNERLRLACLTAQLEVAHKDARWHARKAAVRAWTFGSAHSSDEFHTDEILIVR